MVRLLTVLFLLGAFVSTSRAADASAEQTVAEAVKGQTISVVHLWAPWCSNCQHELKSGGWTKMVKDNPSVKFYFVSIWNSGGDGREMLAKYDLTQQPNVNVLADPGPRGAGHIQKFLGLPVSWIPTTWVFKGGDLRYALNYGEIRFPMLQQMITDSGAEW
jgi:thiol-disulfide isomerase/thioredoxin